MKFNKKFKAFTMSEVLITLGVIGVVAAMTLPTVIKKYQQHTMLNKLKSTYSLINQAIKMSEIDNGLVSTWEIKRQSGGSENMYNSSKTFAETYLTPYLKIINTYKDTNDRYSFILNNGSIISVQPQKEFNDVQLVIYFNNPEKTKFGKDKFSVVINVNLDTLNPTIGKNQPSGSVHFFCQGNTENFMKSNSTYGCNKNANRNCCGAWIMYNNWKIPNNYPW